MRGACAQAGLRGYETSSGDIFHPHLSHGARDENSAFTPQTLPRRSRGLAGRWPMRNANGSSTLNNKGGAGAAGRF